MGTGLTYQLDDNDLDAKRWVLESLALQFFGAFYDTSFGRNEGQLEKMIADSDGVKYHEKELARVTKRKEETEKWVKEQWQKEYNELAVHISDENVKSVEKARKLKEKHDAVYADLRSLVVMSNHQIVKDIAGFGMKQLDQETNDTVPYIASIPSLEKYIDEQKAVIKRDLEYHTEELKETRERVRKSLEDYVTLRKETHRILDRE